MERGRITYIHIILKQHFSYGEKRKKKSAQVPVCTHTRTHTHRAYIIDRHREVSTGFISLGHSKLIKLSPISRPRHFITCSTRLEKFMMVLVNTCVVHLGTNKLYCTGNLHEKEYSFVKTQEILNFMLFRFIVVSG